MSDLTRVLFAVDPMEEAPIIPTINKAVVLEKFKDNDGLITNKPQYAADDFSFGSGRIARPPGQSHRRGRSSVAGPEPRTDARADVARPHVQ